MPAENINEIFRTTFDELYELIVRKQKDYGPGNIESFGTAGVIVRLSDKIERLKNLHANGVEPENESLQDTCMDIANYGVILLLLQRDQVFHPRDRFRLVKEA